MRTMSTKSQVQVREKKYKLIYFLRILKKFNISVNITLIEHKIIVKLNNKILKIQLDLKLK